jgi:hypothetical protein
MRRACGWVLLASSGILLGCPADVEVGIRPRSTVDHLTFTISRGSGSKPTELSLLRVESCNSVFGGTPERFWQLEPLEHPSQVNELAYGTTPAGYRVTLPPRPLSRNACYAVLYAAKDELYFVTTATGGVRRVTQDEAKRLSQKPAT